LVVCADEKYVAELLEEPEKSLLVSHLTTHK